MLEWSVDQNGYTLTGVLLIKSDVCDALNMMVQDKCNHCYTLFL